MRVSDDRYCRDLRRFNLAVRMLQHEARTSTICAWTGLNAERIRNLARSHGHDEAGAKLGRHRGPSPRRLSPILSNPILRAEVAAMAGLCQILRVIPAEHLPTARSTLPSVARGERLCYAYELFRVIIPNVRLTFEQLVLLVTTLAEGDPWSTAICNICHAVILCDRLSMARLICEECSRNEVRGHVASVAAVNDRHNENEGSTYLQGSLFEGEPDRTLIPKEPE
jgi:hypothetical protein